MPAHTKVVVIGTSAGGADALRRLLSRLPSDFPAPVLVVMHIGSHYSILPKILEKDAKMPVRHAEDHEAIVPSTVLLAPPDQHMLVEDGLIRLSRGAKENFSRPAIDPLFRCAAIYYRENAIGVILTGFLDDGTIGLQAIKAYGGVALVQDPDDADEPAMPRSALQHVKVDACLTLDGLAERLIALTAPQAADGQPEQDAAPDWNVIEAQGRFNLRRRTDVEELNRIGVLAGITCPECHGALWEVKSSQPLQFRCHTGHAYTEQTLLEGHDLLIEEAVWAAIRALHEKQMLLKRLATTVKDTSRIQAADEHEATARALASHAEILSNVIVGLRDK